MATLRQLTAFGPGKYRGREFSKSRLQEFAEGTNRAIAAGIPIPLLKRHAPIDANDSATMQFAREEGQGWITKVGVDAATGDLWWEAKDVPQDAVEGVNQGRIRFSSPEFRPVYKAEKEGVYTGPMIRHFAFSYKPGNPHQGPIEVTKAEASMALDESDTAWQFDESEREPLALEQVSETEQFAESHHNIESKKFPGHSHYVGYGDGTWHIHKHPKGWKATHQGNGKGAHHGSYVKANLKEISDVLAAHAAKASATQHDEARPDSSYKGSKTYEGGEHSDASLPPSSGKSIDWATLINDKPNLNQVLEAIRSGKTKEEIQRQFKISYECYLAAMGAFKTSQHAETSVATATQHDEEYGDSHHLVKKHGYKLLSHDSHRRIYGHPTGKSVDLYPGGKWTHYHNKPTSTGHESVQVGGKGYESLESHLQKMHSTQHDEAQPPKKKVDATPTDAARSRADSEAPLEDNGDATGAPPPTGEVNDFNNPDMPPKATDKSKLKAVLAGLAQKNVILPSDFDFDSDGAIDILLGCINSSIAAENKAKAEAEPEEEEEGDSVKDAPMPFSEQSNSYGASVMFTPEEIAAAPESLRPKMEAQNTAMAEANAKAQQFDEERREALNTSARDKAVETIRAAKIPAGLKTVLQAGYLPAKTGEAATIQFDEGEEQPTFTATQVAEMVAKALPTNFQFSEKDIREVETPKGKRQIGVDGKGNPVFAKESSSEQFFETEGDQLPNGHVTPEEAERIVAANPVLGAYLRRGTSPSLSQQVAESTRLNPSQMVQ